MAEEFSIEATIRRALAEDVGTGDITTDSVIPPGRVYSGKFIAKEDGYVAGIEAIRTGYKVIDPAIRFTSAISDGDFAKKGVEIAAVQGEGRALLSSERVLLNILQRMSGIATITRAFVDLVQGTGVLITDTRKTAPGLRVLDKWAVRIGGGTNHRSGLYDMILIKENHVAAAGGIRNAVDVCRRKAPPGMEIEVEVRNLAELQEALEAGADRILLDNMDPAAIRIAVQQTAGRVPLEASGNVTLQTVAALAATGVQYISVGMLTHSVRSLDISFLLDEIPSGTRSHHAEYDLAKQDR